MAKGKRKPWENRWRKLRQLGRGGHGVTFLVERDDKPGETYVLKELKEKHNTDPERRERMHREVQALRGLDHPRLPKIIESNTNSFANVSVPLYFVMDYINGPTLEERVMDERLQRLQPDDAVNLVIELSDILIYCHNRGIIHRDIKQDNIVLRGANSADPVLIDFGLSFNEVNSGRSPLTPEGQQLGNRFLYLPELQTADSSKRYVESDISQVCGVLFYGLTGKVPVHLKDHEGLKPHERASAKGMLDQINSPALTSLFDKGFERDLSKRFRSAEALKGRFYEVRDEFKYTLASFSQNAATVTLETVMPEIRTTLTKPAREESLSTEQMPAKGDDFHKLQKDFAGEHADALMYASLLGAWNEKAEGDLEAIERLIEGDD